MLIPLFLICVTGCQTISVESNKDSAYRKPLSRVLIYLSIKKSVYDPSIVAKQLSEKLAEHGVLTQTIIKKETASEDMQAVLSNAASIYSPDQILTILTKEDNSFRAFGLGGGANVYSVERHVVFLDVTVSDVVTSKNIWRAFVYGMSKPLENSLVDTIMQKLDVDSLLPAPITTNKTP